MCVSVRIQQQFLLDKLANVFLSLEGTLFPCKGVLYSLTPAFFAEAKLPVKNSIRMAMESTKYKDRKTTHKGNDFAYENRACSSVTNYEL